MSVDMHHPAQDDIFNRQNKESTLKGGESSSMPPENKNWLHSKQTKIIASVATLSILATIGVENLLNNKSDKATSPTNKAAVTDTLNPGNETQKLPAIPNEAKQFVSEVGGRYADPVSTYYAVEAYKKEHADKTPVLSDEFINKYDNSGPQDGDLSILGFTAYRLPLNAEVTQKTFIDIFNNYTKPNLDLYMNLLSKNPSAKAVAIIDNEFKSYCSENTAFKNDDAQIAMLMATAKNEVAQYGSAVNYSVAKATDKLGEKDATIFPMADGIMFGSIPWGKQVVKNYADSGIDLVIDADKYSGKTVSRVPNVKHGVTLTIWRQPVTGDADYSHISIGQNN